MNKLVFRARIFQKRESNIWDNRNRINKVISFCALAILGLMFFNDDKFNNGILCSIIIILLLFRVALLIGKFGIERKSDEEEYFLEIFENEIRFAENSIKIIDITSMNLKINNYYGEAQYTSPNDMRPSYSQGFDNKLEFTTKNNQNHIIRFQLENKEHKGKLIPFSNRLIANKIITPEKGTKFLNLLKD